MNNIKNHPILSCGFRPFFLLGSLYAIILIGVWIFSWQGWLPMPTSIGGPIVWHAYELIYGFTLAAVIGFLLTATPEFLTMPEVNGNKLLLLVTLWLIGRITFWLTAIIGLIPAAISNILLLILVIAFLAPYIWRDKGCSHMSFIYVLLLLLALEVNFYICGFTNMPMMPSLYAAIGIIMVLIIVALSRISMRVINGLEDGIDLFDEKVEYLARPPLRNMAILTIGLFTLFEFTISGNKITGWLALAASAAMLNLLNDWHIGKPLFNRWVIALYTIYWLMALGYLLMGLSILSDWNLLSAARHILTIGVISFSIFLIMVFAGQVHSGRVLTYRYWMLFGLISLITAIILRVMMSLPHYSHYSLNLMFASGIFWLVTFVMFVMSFWQTLTKTSADGRKGCL